MAPKNPNSDDKSKPNVSDALVPVGAGTAALMGLSESTLADAMLTNEDFDDIRKRFTAELFVRPHAVNVPDGVRREFFLRLVHVEPFTLRSKNVVNMVVAEAARENGVKTEFGKARLRVRFIESAGMRGNFRAERVGKEFVMMHSGEVPGQQQPCQTYAFTWEP